ncbi:GNAT family N-acetyltransferase [Saccharothrix lopnurensis]|uniref:GNAT family N-acetyltransferase n=1 Tax=Saccharothrix lopnurensis TaxID=1670621 RepID=A0ABW1PED6_9PSEU
MAVDSPLATALVHDYLIDIIGRYHGRPATRAEVDRALVEDPTDDLVAFYVGRHRGQAAGCAGFRLVDPGTAELKRLYVAAGARGTGGGAALLAAVERGAAALGARRVRLDTRADLVEARALYAGHGYAEVAPFNADPYAGYWFEKRL